MAGIRGTGRREANEEIETWEEPSHRVCFQAYAPGFLFISTAGSVGSHGCTQLVIVTNVTMSEPSLKLRGV